MEEKITVLVENFNIKKSKYEFGKQNISKVTIPALKKILKELPFGEEVLIPPRIITDKLFITTHNDDWYYFNDNNKTSFFMNFKDSKYEKKKGFKFKLDELEDLFNPSKKSKKMKVITIILNIIDKAWFFFVVLNIFFFINLLIQELNTPVANMIFLIFLLWLNFFCIYSLSYGISKVIKLRKNPQKIKLEYSIPFITSFETVDVSEAVI